ncbi:MAG: Tn3 family transposase [Acidimicrobiales bacterium]
MPGGRDLPHQGRRRVRGLQALQRGGGPTTLASALAEVGRISRTIAILDYVTNPAQRRRILVQLNRQETRHQLARDVFHGRRGHVYQAYRPGQEQQLGALGLVTNVLTLWNSGYMDHAVEHLRSEGTTIADEDLEHLSPLQHDQVNLHGRYGFSAPDHLRHGPLRPLTTHGGR